jgi:hypothetical protein
VGELTVHSNRYSRGEPWRFKAIEPVRRLARISADRIRTAAGAAGKEREMERLSRRSFMKIAGAATGAAALAAAPPIARAAVGEEDAQPTKATYVRNAERGEVTVTSGTVEHTYRDRALVQRLLRASGRKGVR